MVVRTSVGCTRVDEGRGEVVQRLAVEAADSRPGSRRRSAPDRSSPIWPRMPSTAAELGPAMCSAIAAREPGGIVGDLLLR